jgi:hypothetical protein
MTDTYSTPNDTGELRASELQGSLGERLGAQGSEAFMGGMRTFTRIREFGQAESGQETLGSQIGRLQQGEDLNDLFQPQEHDGQSFGGPRQPVDVPIADAKARIKQQGLETQLTLPDQPTIRQGVLDLMLQHAQERRDYDAAVSRGPQGFFPGALGMLTEIGAGMIDPVNLAAFSIPVLGEARWGQMLASAGESLTRRAGVKALQGAAQGAVGSAALIPGDWWLHTKDGQDYTMADALKSVVMGAGMGATFHAGFGAIGDVRARARGLPLPGSPKDMVLRGLMHGTHVPAAALESEGLPAEEIPGIAGPDTAASGGEPQPNLGPAPGSIPPHPAEILADLPPAAREDAYRATAADVIAGRPARTAEMLQEAAKEDPRIAESVPGVEAFHGSPYDFDRFDSSKIGAGEGAQSYGHGLYFAENEGVARTYQESLKRPGEIVVDGVAHQGQTAEGFAAKSILENGYESTRRFADGAVAEGILPDYWKAVRAATERFKSADIKPAPESGVVYKVHIAADREHFLDWDKPLSEQPQILAKISPELRAELEDMLDQAGYAADLEPFSGRELYQLINRKFEDPKLASEFAREAGIPGIKYLDQGSRRLSDAEIREEIERIKETEERAQKYGQAAAPGSIGWTAAKAAIARWEAKIGKPSSHNFVVFDDKLIRITHKNGQEVGLDEMKAEQAKAAAAEASNVVHVQPRKASGPRARPEETRSLFEHIAANGGLRSDDPMIPDVKSSLGRDNHFVPGFGNLIRKPGEISTAAARGGARAPMSLDQARESAVHAGYLEDHGEHSGGQSTSTVRDLLDAVDREASGNRVYRNGAEPPRSARDQAQHERELENHMDKGLGDYGVDLDRIPSKTRARTLEIMDKEGVTDPLDAYERAVMEETEHGAQAGEHERIPETIPGWDVADDAGAAPGAGGAAEAGREPGPGGPARDAGQGDRAAGRPGTASARGVKADFQKFADGKRAVDDPDEVAASKAADKTPEPQSIEPTKAVSAAEAAAKEADQLVADILPTLSDKERKIFEDALRELKDDKEARDQVVRDGAACLAEAMA